MSTCVFCGFTGKLTKEHVFGQWLTRIGLDSKPVQYMSGPLNQIRRNLGVRPPFQQTVRDVCATCNHGWMSHLEATAQRVLTPHILGDSGTVGLEDQGAIAAWVQKTTLVAMLLSSKENLAAGGGLPATEYRELHAMQREVQPLPASQFWIGRYSGTRGSSVTATPMTVVVDGVRELNQPQGYAMTVVLGKLVLQGVRFTTPSLRLGIATRHSLSQIWPTIGPVSWPCGTAVEDRAFFRFTAGEELCSLEQHIDLKPWKPATDLPNSSSIGSIVALPTVCGEHIVHYPALLVDEAKNGRFYMFMTSCGCPTAYLVHTEPDGAHFKAVDAAERISRLYESLPGEEYKVRDMHGSFYCKAISESV